MDEWGVDGEDYIAAVRAGALDPYGRTADELEQSLVEYESDYTERLLALSDAEVEELAASGAPIPQLRREPEPLGLAELRLDAEFADECHALEQVVAHVEGKRRTLLACHMQRALDGAGDSGTRLKELAMMAAVEVGLTAPGMVGRMTEAHTIVTRLTAAHEAAADGRITVGHLRVIERETRPLLHDAEVPRAVLDGVVDELVDAAERTSVTRLRSRAQRIVNAALTTPLQQRHDTARSKRRVDLFDRPDGMSDLVLHGPSAELHAAHDRLTQGARAKAKDDPRSFDQLRADAMQELLLAGVSPEDLHHVSRITATVGVVIPISPSIWTELEPQAEALGAAFPAMLDGRTLVDPTTARRLALDAPLWERIFTHPVTGMPVVVDTYRPTAAQRRHMRARDTRCRAPGCARPARTADLDHTHDHALGGQTSLENLEHLCRFDHTIKHGTRWQVEQRPDGVLRWTSPIGQVIDDHPEPIGPRFVDLIPDDPDPPWGGSTEGPAEAAPF